MKYKFVCIMIFYAPILIMGQGYNHTWLLGYGNWANKGRINFDNSNYQLQIEPRQFGFFETQGNISDINGNYLMSSNGVSILNSDNSIMINGNGLNPNTYTSNNLDGNRLPNGNIILPFPDDTTKYILFHQTGNHDPNYNWISRDVFYSIIDITGDNGKGEVIQKNISVIQDSLGWGLSACKHANGRDWWIMAIKDTKDKFFKILLTPSGIDTVMTQDFTNPQPYSIYLGQPTFSPDGRKFAYSTMYHANGYWYHEVRLFSFDRCTGFLTNSVTIDIGDPEMYGFGVAFSSNSKYLYAANIDMVFQFNTDTTDIVSSIDTVAIYDGFISGLSWCCPTNFYLMYLAANGRIYITSTNGVQHIHEMNYPDSSGNLCDLQQHSISLGIWHGASVPNHPNYYLGCDTTLGCTPCYYIPNVTETGGHDFNFNIYPNPSSGNFSIIYLLPQNKEGKLEVFDITGKVVYAMKLPQWSTLQQISLPSYISNGLYNCVITSDGQRVSRKIAIIR